ncbi:hypothetical protein C2W62_07920 [Candidatus Entotheonella serta]|nr:hypothetical protein C2W62_07920 [Candidatus Entotheonella serta]
MQRTGWIWLGFLAFGLGLVHSGQMAHGAYQWRTLNVGIEVESSGDLLITETQSYHITDKPTRQLQRTIPLANVDRITDVKVFENERALEVHTGIKDEQFRICWQVSEQSIEMRTFVVRYRVQGGVRVHPDGDQIVWTALFGERATRLPQGSVTLRVPSELAGEIQGSQSYGVPATIRNLDSRTLSFMPNAELQPDETLKVKIIVPHGRLEVPIPKWQQGIDAPYTLPGIVGQIDVTVLIVLGIGLFGCLYYAHLVNLLHRY